VQCQDELLIKTVTGRCTQEEFSRLTQLAKRSDVR